MEIISMDNKRFEAGATDLPSGTLYFETKEEANNYADKNKWCNGTVCYTKLLEVGVLHNGAWNWA